MPWCATVPNTNMSAFQQLLFFLGFSVGREQCLNYLNFSQSYNRNTDNTELINIW